MTDKDIIDSTCEVERKKCSSDSEDEDIEEDLEHDD